MRHPMLTKTLATGVLALVLVIPLSMIQGIVAERKQRRDSVWAEMERGSVSPQRIAGPLLVVPYKRTYTEPVVEASSGAVAQVERTELGRLQLPPEQLTVETHITTEQRNRGIFPILVYETTSQIQGRIDVPDRFGVDASSRYEFGEPALVLGISDTRGIRGPVAVTWGGASHPFQAGAGRSSLKTGIQAAVPVSRAAQSYAFTIDLRLQGMRSLEIVPVGRNTQVTMESTWPHPSFTGKHLPDARTVGKRGFEARWLLSHLATDINRLVEQCGNGDCAELWANTLGVTFFHPVDVYAQTERSLKYGFLFVSITFVVFFLYELLKRLAIHPVQYGLVGFALALFFLLLIALSEHLPFGWAYAIATTGCLSLIGFYLRHVLGAVRRSLGFVSLLGALYGMLYVLLRSEDHALLLGAMLLFGLLAGIMTLTRRIDWYQVAEQARGRS